MLVCVQPFPSLPGFKNSGFDSCEGVTLLIYPVMACSQLTSGSTQLIGTPAESLLKKYLVPGTFTSTGTCWETLKTKLNQLVTSGKGVFRTPV